MDVARWVGFVLNVGWRFNLIRPSLGEHVAPVAVGQHAAGSGDANAQVGCPPILIGNTLRDSARKMSSNFPGSVVLEQDSEGVGSFLTLCCWTCTDWLAHHRRGAFALHCQLYSPLLSNRRVTTARNGLRGRS